MKKILFIIIAALFNVYVFGQSDNIIRPDTIKHVAKGNNTKMYHDNTRDVYIFETNKDTFEFNKPISINGAPVSGESSYSDSSGIAFKFIGDTLFLGNDTITEIHNVTDTTIRFRVNGQNIILATSSGGGGGISSVTYSDFEQDVVDTFNLKLAASIFNSHRDSSEIHFLQSEISITASQVSDFDTEVSNNTDVQANIDSNHWHNNKATLDKIESAYTDSDSTKLVGIEAGAQVNTIDAGDNVSELVNDAGYLTSEVQVLSISNDTIYLTGGSFVKLPASSGGTIDTSYIYAAIAAKQDTTVTDTSLSTRYDSLYIKVCNETLDTCEYLLVIRDNVLGTSDSVLYANKTDTLGGLPASSYLTAEVDGSVTNEIQVISISNDTIFLSDGGFVKLPASAGGDFDTTNIYQILGSKQDTIAWDTSLTTTEDTLLLLVYSRNLQTKDTIKVIKGELAAGSDTVLFAEKSGNSDSLGGVVASSYLRTSGDTATNLVVLDSINVERLSSQDAIGIFSGNSSIRIVNNISRMTSDNGLLDGFSRVSADEGNVEILWGDFNVGEDSYPNLFFESETNNATFYLSNVIVNDGYITAGEKIVSYSYIKGDSLRSEGGISATGTVTAGAFSSAFITDTYAASKTVDMSTGQKHKMTVSGDMTINFTNIVEGVVYTYHFYQDGTGGHTITLGTWNSVSAYPLENTGDFDTDASDMTKLQFEYDGTNIIYGITNSNL